MDTITLSYDDFVKAVEMTEKNLNAFDEAVEFNIFKEYNAIKNKKTHETSKYCYGLMLMLKYIINCVQHDRINGDYYNEENNKNVLDGGKYLYEAGGNECMYQVLTQWIPKRYRTQIDYMWDGIGEWKG